MTELLIQRYLTKVRHDDKLPSFLHQEMRKGLLFIHQFIDIEYIFVVFSSIRILIN